MRPILEVVRETLAARKGELRQIAREMSPDSEESYYSWLTKVNDGRIVDPGVSKIQELFEYLERRKNERRTPA